MCILFFLLFIFQTQIKACEIIEETESYTIYRDRLTEQITFSLHLDFKPNRQLIQMSRKEEARSYISEILPESGLSFAKVAENQAQELRLNYTNQPKALIKGQKELFEMNITHYQKLYRQFLNHFIAGRTKEARVFAEALLALEKNPKTRPNPLALKVLRDLYYAKKKNTKNQFPQTFPSEVYIKCVTV